MLPSLPPGIRKYYIGLGVLMLLALGFLVYAFTQAGAAKSDRRTNKTVEQISSKLDLSTATTGTVPDSLQAAGITDPAPTVKYTKLSATQYKICIEYKSAGNGFDAGWFSLLGGTVSAGTNDQSYSKSTDYFDTTVEYNHKKGQNCQTVTPYGGGYGQAQPLNLKLGPSGSTSPSAVSSCSDYGSLTTYGYLKVTAVNQTLNSISFSGDTSGGSSAGAVTLVYDSDTIFCDSSQQLTDISAVKAGSYVVVYTKSSTDKTIARIDIY